MAIIHYVKDGPRPNSYGPGRDLPLANLESVLADQEIRYLGKTPPQFNPEAPSRYPLRVVVEVTAEEATGTLFLDSGFYFLLDLNPEDAESLLFERRA